MIKKALTKKTEDVSRFPNQKQTHNPGWRGAPGGAPCCREQYGWCRGHLAREGGMAMMAMAQGAALQRPPVFHDVPEIKGVSCGQGKLLEMHVIEIK